MHCWKILNIYKQYGLPRILLWTVIAFILTLCTSYLAFTFAYTKPFNDNYFFIFAALVIALYPIHKGVHYLTLLDYRSEVETEWKLMYGYVPTLHLRIKEILPKRRYIITRLAPFIIINSVIIGTMLFIPTIIHYGSILLAYHTSICVIDILYVKNLLRSPKEAQIEETPRGFEILVPPNIR